tara:strand:- start:962 stop:1243 length:282 start_codon:yes stop_codon:yes gene_type:complete
VRKLYIDIAKKNGLQVRCYWFMVDTSLCEHLNKLREIVTKGKRPHVPRMAFSNYHKNFEEPIEAEGIHSIERVEFTPVFESDEERKMFYSWTF